MVLKLSSLAQRPLFELLANQKPKKIRQVIFLTQYKYAFKTPTPLVCFQVKELSARVKELEAELSSNGNSTQELSCEVARVKSELNQVRGEPSIKTRRYEFPTL